MPKFTFHEQLMGLDPSTTMNYNINELMKSIVTELDRIALAVMGKEVYGAHFVSLHPDNNQQLICHGTMTKLNHLEKQDPAKDTYLWVMIDKIEAAYRARFFTPECVALIQQEDLTAIEDYNEQKKQKQEDAVGKLLDKMSKDIRDAYLRGIRMGIAFSLMTFLLIVFAIYFVF